MTTASNITPLSAAAEAILEKVRAMPQRDQARIVAFLLESLEPEDDLPDAAQTVEILRRSDEIDRGSAKLIESEEAMRLYRERTKA